MTTPRRSGRARNKRSHTTAVSEKSNDDNLSNFSDDMEHDSESDANTKPRKTRRKRQKLEAEPENANTQEVQIVKRRKPEKYVRGRRGQLKLMTEMPIDTLHEIFRQLDPLDLLHLSWASKSLRVIVMEKSARYIWVDVYERLYESSNPPPRCPEDLNLLQYTRFLYYKKCMICHTRKGFYTCWMARLRVCYHCLVNSDQFFIPDDYDENEFGWFVIHARQTIFLLPNHEGDRAEKVWIPEIESEKSNRLREGKQEFDLWEERCSNDDLDRRRSERKAAIFKKLAEIGWDESYIKEINKGQLPDRLPGLGPAKKLTKKDWMDLQPKIEDVLSRMKECHLARLKAQRFSKRWNDFENKFKEWDQTQTLDSPLRPLPGDISILEPFRTIIFTSDTEGAEFKIDDIDRVANEWIEWRDDFLFSLLPRDLQDRYQANKPSLQPLAIFCFSNGHRTLLDAGPDGIYVRRAAPSYYAQPISDEKEIRDAFIEAKLTYTRPWQWANRGLRFDTAGFETAVEILEFLGMDPYTTHSTQAAEYKQEYRCSKCCDLRTYNCEGMIQHDWSLHSAEIRKRTPLGTRWILPEH